MSRLGKKPIPVPATVKFAVKDRNISVEGPKGKLQWEHRREVSIKFDEAAKQIVV
jgi:large subunit ribosomal protein L6